MRRTSRSAVVHRLLLLTLSLAARPAGADWRSEADARIAQVRQRDLRLQVVDPAGRPLSGATVRVRQVRRAFPFGAAIGPGLLKDPQRAAFFADHFNTAVFENASKWYANEAVRGREDYATADALLAWCRERDIPVRGHCVFWAPDKWQPKWVRPLTGDALRRAVERRLTSAVTHFRGRFISWDVNNEMLHGDFFAARLGPAIRPWMFQQVRALDPHARLFVNEYNLLSVDQAYDEVDVDAYVAHTRRLIDAGAPIGGVGIQGHLWGEDLLARPQVIRDRLDRVARLGLPIWISEFDVADPNEALCADKLALVYRTAYSHPAVAGIVMWTVWTDASWRGPRAGIVRPGGILNAAGRRYEALLDEWSTDTTGTTDTAGVYALRGFHGDYEVTITPPGGRPRTQSLTLSTGTGPLSATLRLP